MSILRLLAVVTLVLMLSRIAEHAIAATAEVENISVTPAKSQRPISLRDRLIVGLQARLKPEVAFVDAVVVKVNTGQIPQRLVDETFFLGSRSALGSSAMAGRGGRSSISSRR